MNEQGSPRDAAITTSNLTKRYKTVAAISDLSLTVPRGTIYGFLGPNGAGKTTTIKLLMGFIKSTTGSATIFGHDCWRDGVAARRDIGFLVVAEALYPDMSGEAQLDYAARLSGRPPILRTMLLDALELSQDALQRRLGSYSKGMRQKLALTAAIQHNPALLILDEPTDGLDPLIQRAFEEILRSLQQRGQTIFMSSHDLAEVERVCERVAVVRGGKLVAEETIAGLQAMQRRRAEIQFVGDVPLRLTQLPGIRMISQNDHHVELAVDQDVNPLIRFLADYDIADFAFHPPSLEDIFMTFYDTDAQPQLPSVTATIGIRS